MSRYWGRRLPAEMHVFLNCEGLLRGYFGSWLDGLVLTSVATDVAAHNFYK